MDVAKGVKVGEGRATTAKHKKQFHAPIDPHKMLVTWEGGGGGNEWGIQCQ